MGKRILLQAIATLLWLVSAVLGMIAMLQVYEATRVVAPFVIPIDPLQTVAHGPQVVFVARVVLIILAIAGSYMVSYTRARAESLGVECKVGLMQRPERVVLLIIGSLLGSIPRVGPTLLQCSILILALSSNITAMHRILHVRNRILRETETK